MPPFHVIAALILGHWFISQSLRILATHYDQHRSRHDLVVSARQARIDYYTQLAQRRSELSGSNRRGNQPDAGTPDDTQPDVAGTIQPARQAA